VYEVVAVHGAGKGKLFGQLLTSLLVIISISITVICVVISYY